MKDGKEENVMEQAGFPFDIAIVDRRIEPPQMCSMHSKPIRRFLRIGNVEIALCDDCLMSAKACIDAEASVVKRKLEEEEQHKPCKHRKREERDGVTMDWCYAIGCCEVGDMPCEYCVDHPERYKKDA